MDLRGHLLSQREMLLTRGIMVDVETAGPALHRHALLSLGANLVSDPDVKFYIELKPDKFDFVPEALRITGFTLEGLTKTGIAPKEAIFQFHAWVASHGIKRPLFVARAANFDWKFYDYYAWQYVNENPFGHFAFDTISAFGALFPNREPPHHAGQDARIQTQDLRKFFNKF
jgi:ribonuclease T